jgi:predicted ArsR family transcriptional regulator
MSLFDPWPDPPAQRHSVTSVQAAEQIKPVASTQRARVLAFLEEHGPASDHAIQDALNLDPSSERPRRVELERAGLIHVVGQTHTRTGRKANVYGVAR